MPKILKWFLILIVLFAVLDGLRDTFLPESRLSYLKEVVVFVLISILYAVAVLKRDRIISPSLKYFYLFGIYFLVIAAITTYYYQDHDFNRGDGLGFGGWSIWIKLLVSILLVQTLFWMKEYYAHIYASIPNIYICGVVFYCVLTIVFIVTGWSQNLPGRNWSGRLSIGYPTMDSFVLVIGCAFSAFYLKRKVLVFSLHILFALVLLMQNTASGYLMMSAYIFSMIFWLPGYWKYLPIMIIGAASLSLWYVYRYLEAMGAFGLLLLDKVNGLIFGGETSSVDIRQEQINLLKRALYYDPFSILFGMGGKAAYSVESQYFALFGLAGISGVVLYILLILGIIMGARHSQKPAFVYVGMLIYSVGAISLVGFYLYPFVFFVSFLIVESMGNAGGVRYLTDMAKKFN